MEAMEDRVLLSAADLTALAIPGSIERGVAAHPTTTAVGEVAEHRAGLGAQILANRKSPTSLAVASADGVKGGTAALMATLSSNGPPLAGQIIRFQIKGRAVGKAVTDAQGVATLSNASLKGLKVGFYSTGVVATFNSHATLDRSTRKGTLTVSRFATSLSDVSASGVFLSSGFLTATLTSDGAALPGQVIGFQLNGQNVGSATTNGQGVASLANVSLAGVNAGVYPNAVTASFAGSVTYVRNALAGTLTVFEGRQNLTPEA
jgi:hypothetical protein